MSKISQAYDALLVRLQAVYPTHSRLTNPYKMEENNEQSLRKGYGLAFGSGSNSNRQVSCQLSYERSMLVSLTRVVRANEFNVSAKADVEKSLLEDQFLLIKDIEADPTLGVSDVVAKAVFVSDNGVEYVFGDKDSFLKLESTISVEIFEDLL